MLVKLAGALVLAGSVIVVVIGPVVLPPALVTVIGTLLGEPATKTGAGWPMVVVRSGAATVTTNDTLAALLVGVTSFVLVMPAVFTTVPAVPGPVALMMMLPVPLGARRPRFQVAVLPAVSAGLAAPKLLLALKPMPKSNER